MPIWHAAQFGRWPLLIFLCNVKKHEAVVPFEHSTQVIDMDFFDIFGLLLFGAIGWLWYDSLNVRETAVSATKAACNSEDLLLLDDTVAIHRISLGRDSDGVLRIRRIYDFEYSDTGNNRCTGSVVLLGSRVLVINLNLPDVPVRALLH